MKTLLLKWKEPEAFRCVRDRSSLTAIFPWLRPVGVTAFFAWQLLDWRFESIVPGGHRPTFWAAFFVDVISSFLIFFVPQWLIRRMPSVVKLYSGGIRNTGDTVMLRFRNVKSMGWCDKGPYQVLQLRTGNGGLRSYGVPDLETRGKIEAILVKWASSQNQSG
jgi:hypothetical protein